MLREALDQPTSTCRVCGCDIPLMAWETPDPEAVCAECADAMREGYLQEIAVCDRCGYLEDECRCEEGSEGE